MFENCNLRLQLHFLGASDNIFRMTFIFYGQLNGDCFPMWLKLTIFLKWICCSGSHFANNFCIIIAIQCLLCFSFAKLLLGIILTGCCQPYTTIGELMVWTEHAFVIIGPGNSCCFFGTELLSELMLNCQLDPEGHISMKWYSQFRYFHLRFEFSVVCKMVAISSCP